jgi:hypothetical protein
MARRREAKHRGRVYAERGRARIAAAGVDECQNQALKAARQ